MSISASGTLRADVGRVRHAAALLWIAACRVAEPSSPAAGEPVDAPSEARRAAIASASVGVENEALAAILREQWATHLRDSPVSATRLGVHDWDDRLWDASIEAIERRRADRDRWRAQVRAIDPGLLSPADRETRALLSTDLDAGAALDVCRSHEWNVGVQSNPVSDTVKLHEGAPLGTPLDGEHLVARYRAIPTLIDQSLASLQAGAAAGRFADRQTLERLVALVDRQLAEPLDTWAMLGPAREPPKGWPAAARAAFAKDLHAAVADDVVPAYRRYRTFVSEKLVPHARGPDRPGVSALPDGAACYEAAILSHTTLPLTAQEVHQTGLDEIARIDGEITVLGRQLFGTEDLAATLAHLRGDSSLYFADAAEIETAARDNLARAKAAVPRFFGRHPRADCVVRLVPDFEAPATHIGYYEPPFADGSKPGEYFVNVFAPTTRPRFEARVLAVHESIPGHHLQIAIAQELGELPAFRRHAGYSAYVEGWALYTERLADEMGLYDSDLDRMGMLSFDAWRAGRLVVDTGIHALGWTRARAEAFLMEHTALTPANIANEVDRYIGWPGQALAYKIGQRRMLELRARAESKLGDRFVLSRFHDAVLEGGPVTLDVLAARIDAWIAAGGRSPQAVAQPQPRIGRAE